MRKRTWVCAALVVGVACSKKSENKPAEPATTAPKMVEPKHETPPPADVPVTSKSPEALKAFEQGRDLVDHTRGGEAAEAFKKAIELDPEFAQAHLYLGFVTPGAAGSDEIAKAATLAAKLPEAEQQLIAAFQAERAGDRGKAIAAFEKVLQVAPGAWRVDVVLANQANMAGDSPAAIQRLEHAIQAKPDLGVAYNGIAYGHAAQHEWDQAIVAAKKQVELMPKQPNPQDTLGEIQLMASKFDDAEKSFAAALQVEPKFMLAWQGIALSRAYRGDLKGAQEALDKWKATTVPGEKYEPMVDGAWLTFADNKLPQAVAAFDAIEKDADAKKYPTYAFVALDRAYMLVLAGKYADAAKWFATAQQRGETLPGNAKVQLMRGQRLGLLWAAALAGKPAADADKLLAAIDDDAKADPTNKALQDNSAAARGYIAWAKKDVKGAIAELSKCRPVNTFCVFDLAKAQRKAGDTAGAEASEKQLREAPRREAPVVYVWTHIPTK